LNQQQRELTVERLKGVLKEIVMLVMEEAKVLMCRGVCAASERLEV
jgi:hypothetical protein